MTPFDLAGTVEAPHIESPTTAFLMSVLRGDCRNVIVRPAHWELWRVRASTPEGALKIAEYHFYHAIRFRLELVTTTLPQEAACESLRAHLLALNRSFQQLSATI